MISLVRAALLLCALLFATNANAAPATYFIDTGGCNTGSTTQCSGTTDSATASASGASATITCSATTGPGATPGCSITGSAGQLAGIAVDGSQALFVNCGTNANSQKTFPVVSVDNVTGLVGTTGTPTGCTAATSDWGIGGRVISPGGTTVMSFVAALRAGDIVQFNNTPATRTTGPYITGLTAGSSAGVIKIIGKTGVRPVLQMTGNGSAISFGNQSDWWLENVEVKSACTSGGVISGTNTNAPTIVNVLVSASGVACPGIVDQGASTRIMFSEFTGLGGDAISWTGGFGKLYYGNYIHGNTGNGITNSNSGNLAGVMINNVISGNTGRGIFYSGAPTDQSQVVSLHQNVIYNNGASGVEVSDADAEISMLNNIFMNNGDAAGEFNVKWSAGSADTFGIHQYNVYFHSNCQGSNTGGPSCVSGLTPGSTELTSDPLFVNAGSGNFALQSTSPAKGVGYPGTLLNLPSTGFASIGTFQVQSTTSAGKIIGGGT